MENGSHGDLRQSMAGGDVEKARFAAHSIKGMAANLSLNASFHQVSRLETALKNGLIDQDLLAEYEKTLEITRSGIESYLLETDPKIRS